MGRQRRCLSHRRPRRQRRVGSLQRGRRTGRGATLGRRARPRPIPKSIKGAGAGGQPCRRVGAARTSRLTSRNTRRAVSSRHATGSTGPSRRTGRWPPAAGLTRRPARPARKTTSLLGGPTAAARPSRIPRLTSKPAGLTTRTTRTTRLTGKPTGLTSRTIGLAARLTGKAAGLASEAAGLTCGPAGLPSEATRLHRAITRLCRAITGPRTKAVELTAGNAAVAPTAGARRGPGHARGQPARHDGTRRAKRQPTRTDVPRRSSLASGRSAAVSTRLTTARLPTRIGGPRRAGRQCPTRRSAAIGRTLSRAAIGRTLSRAAVGRTIGRRAAESRSASGRAALDRAALDRAAGGRSRVVLGRSVVPLGSSGRRQGRRGVQVLDAVRRVAALAARAAGRQPQVTAGELGHEPGRQIALDRQAGVDRQPPFEVRPGVRQLRICHPTGRAGVISQAGLQRGRRSKSEDMRSAAGAPRAPAERGEAGEGICRDR